MNQKQQTIKPFLILSLFIASLFISQKGLSQNTFGWSTLADVTFAEKFDEEIQGYWLIPTFGNTLETFRGKTVTLEGYFIPIDIDGGFYVLSKFPYANCFFCGGAGEESVIELKFKDTPRTYKMDDVVTFEGVFHWNNKPFELPYILEEVVQVR